MVEERRLIGFFLVVVLAAALLIAFTNANYIAQHINSDLALILIFVVPLLFCISMIVTQMQSILRQIYALVSLFLLIVAPLSLPLIMFVLMLSLSSWFSWSMVPVISENGMLPYLGVFALLPTAVVAVDFLIERSIRYKKDEISKKNENLLRQLNYATLAIFILSLIGAAFIIGTISDDLYSSVKGTVLLFMIFPFALNLFFVGDLLITFNPNYSGVVVLIMPLAYLVFAILGAILGAVASFF